MGVPVCGPPAKVLTSSSLTETCNGGSPLLLASPPPLLSPPLRQQYTQNIKHKIRIAAPPHAIPIIAGFVKTIPFLGAVVGASVETDSGGDVGATSCIRISDTPETCDSKSFGLVPNNVTYAVLSSSVLKGEVTIKFGVNLFGSIVSYSTV